MVRNSLEPLWILLVVVIFFDRNSGSKILGCCSMWVKQLQPSQADNMDLVPSVSSVITPISFQNFKHLSWDMKSWISKVKLS
jgi:hypothetical protein